MIVGPTRPLSPAPSIRLAALVTLAFIGSLACASEVAAQTRPPRTETTPPSADPSAANATRQIERLHTALPARPYEAPLFRETPVLPPLPAEYLKHDQAGIRFAYHPTARERVRPLIEECDSIRNALSVSLGEPVLSSIDVRVAVGASDFDRIVPANSPQGVGPVAISQSRLLVMALPSGPSSTSEVRTWFRRGLSHLALDEVAGVDHLPRWLRVGFAIHFSGDRSMSRSGALWWASMERRILPLADLDHHLVSRSDHDGVAAAEAASFVEFLLGEVDNDRWQRLVHGTRDHDFNAAALDAFQQSDTELELNWRHDVAKHKAFLPVLGVSTALWVLFAAGVQLRRRRKEKLEEKKADSESRPLKKAKFVRLGKDKSRRGPATHIPEPEVPKVAHNGSWHTLH